MNNYIWVVVFLFSYISLYRLINYYLSEYKKIYEKRNLYDKLPEIFSLLEKSKQMAFEKIWKEEIIVLVESGMSLNHKDINKPLKTYLNIILESIGESVEKDLINIIGSKESLIYSLSLEFVSKVIENEVTFKSKVMLDTLSPDEFSKENIMTAYSNYANATSKKTG